jgi:hypothetical protein
MSRHNQGPRLDFLRKRDRYYIVWTENGRSKQRSTGTANRESAEIELARFLRQRKRCSSPRDPAEALVTDILIDYMNARAGKVRAVSRIAYAVEPLSRFFEGISVQQAPSRCDASSKWRRNTRQIKSGIARRELNVLRAAANHAFRTQQLTRSVPFELPPEGAPRDTVRRMSAEFGDVISEFRLFRCTSMLDKQGENAHVQSSEGKGRTFESCRVRHKINDLVCTLRVHRNV